MGSHGGLSSHNNAVTGLFTWDHIVDSIPTTMLLTGLFTWDHMVDSIPTTML